MDLIKAAALEGEWFIYADDGQFRVRRIPAGKDQELYFQHFGRSRKYSRKKGTETGEVDLARATEYTRQKAAFALVDSRNVSVPRQILGGTPLADAGEGQTVTLDGHWSPEVKERVLFEVKGLAGWVIEKAESLDREAAEEEAEAGEI